MKKLIALTGAGMSAESGLKTFRDAGGLWENHDIMQVASPEGWASNMRLVLQFYNERRRNLLETQPNPGHIALASLEPHFDISVITQNVDDLHERAGSRHIVHLHGELRKARSTRHPDLIYPWDKDIHPGDLCERGEQLRPHIVWFGEAVTMMEDAVQIISNADIVIVIGTSMQVYPAAGLVYYAPPDARIFYIDPKPQINVELSLRRNLEVIRMTAGEGVPLLAARLISEVTDGKE